jgi:peptidyl-prolyl cis-trans isomerase A (cyclophilin A)
MTGAALCRRTGGLLTLAFFWAAAAWAQETTPASPPSAAAPATPAPPPEAAANTRVILQTALGNIILALEQERAPITVHNFLHYVDQKRFDGITFYRAMKVGDEGQYGLIQGGLRGNPKRVFKPIAHEPTTTTGLSHTSGAISMARADPGTANADFFIVVGDLVGLDAQPDRDDPGYAVFGHVVEGMDVVQAILDQPRSEEGEGVMKGQMIAVPVKILSVRRAAP